MDCPVTIRSAWIRRFTSSCRTTAAAQKEVAEEIGVKPAVIKKRGVALHEANPMLGHRGCRLSITYPEILEMQVRAITEAAINCSEQKDQSAPGDHDPAGRYRQRARQCCGTKVEETIRGDHRSQEVQRPTGYLDRNHD